jgi:pimeloyl-ACP methyl ester carboxylesterase
VEEQSHLKQAFVKMEILRKWKMVQSLCLMIPFLFSKGESLESPVAQNYFYDARQVRYQLFQTNEDKPYNWLFFPGGPGADSSYFANLIGCLNLPGNVWLIDLPGNGSNLSDGFTNFDLWMEIFPEVIKQFKNPIVVGHSFGGMFPLLFPELEKYLKGFVILNSAPALWLQEAVAYSKAFNLPDLSQEMQEFTDKPSQESFDKALAACVPYYFPPSSLEEGKKWMAQVPCAYLPAVWWQRKAMELNFTAKWIPQKVITLIVNARFDCICPFTLFQKDERFQRPNIEFLLIENGGHMPWMENPIAVKEAFRKFTAKLNASLLL